MPPVRVAETQRLLQEPLPNGGALRLRRAAPLHEPALHVSIAIRIQRIEVREHRHLDTILAEQE
eukprot:12518156-Alexandrium_andersonii.AAC.1